MATFRVTQVGYNCENDSGGSYKSIQHFKNVFDSTVISFTKSDVTEKINDAIEIFHVPYSESWFNRYAYTFSPVKDVAETLVKNSDLVICHGFYRYHFDWAVKIAIQNNIPYWIIPHGSLDPYVFTYRTLSKKIWFWLKGNRSFERANAIIFATSQEYSKALPYLSGTTAHVVSWPIEPVEIVNRLEARTRIRTENLIPLDAKLLLYIGRIHPMKRPIETIKAVSACGDSKVHLLMVGPDSDVLTQSMCKQYCKDNNIINVHFVPPVYGNSKYEYYAAADAFISLSHRENFGYVVAEAMSAGIPLILSPGNDLSKEIELEDCAWLLPDTEDKTVIEAIGRFAVAEGSDLVAMGKRAKCWADSHLSFDTFKTKLLAIRRLTQNK